MTKKHFIALADAIREHNRLTPTGEGTDQFSIYQQMALADFCKSQNPGFNRSRWIGYIAGKCGPNGGKVS